MNIRGMITLRQADAKHGMDLATSDVCYVAERIALAEAREWLGFAAREYDSASTPSDYLLDVLACGLYRHGQDIDWALGRLTRS
jgi:hypothetical protein